LLFCSWSVHPTRICSEPLSATHTAHRVVALTIYHSPVTSHCHIKVLAREWDVAWAWAWIAAWASASVWE
jgi:hypothetical protein